MIKPLSLVLLMFPTLGACAMQDDLFYNNRLHHQAPVVQVERSWQPVSSYQRMPAPHNVHGHTDMRHQRKYARNHYRPRGRVPAAVHGHESRNNNVHGHD
ncbi:hypothetical protein [Legionella sp. CNM-4043-24]|uniref:hypothetical protein n=1 Tax=Legionella sp. CNM-4043-24 TaxID=3421646 RepID=UPI00403AFD87